METAHRPIDPSMPARSVAITALVDNVPLQLRKARCGAGQRISGR